MKSSFILALLVATIDSVSAGSPTSEDYQCDTTAKGWEETEDDSLVANAKYSECLDAIDAIA
jgi:hypothetical protein